MHTGSNRYSGIKPLGSTAPMQALLRWPGMPHKYHYTILLTGASTSTSSYQCLYNHWHALSTLLLHYNNSPSGTQETCRPATSGVECCIHQVQTIW